MGPLQGIKILEIAGIGPGPFAAMMLSDMGAEVIRVDRAQSVTWDGSIPEAPNRDVLNRGRRSIAVDLKSPDGVEAVLRMVEQSDGLVEGFRPGVAERLGIGPDECLGRNPRLVYGRMTGWGQDGPYAQSAGHDINYIALAGVLEHLGRAGQKPTPPINLIGDFGGGGMLMAFGLVCGLLEAQRSGQGQVVDAAMVDGSAVLMTMVWAFRAIGFFGPERGTNVLDTGAWYYDTYETADGRHVSIGSLEPQFFQALLRTTGLDEEPDVPHPMDKSRWPEMKERMAAVFKQKTRDEWCEIMEGEDVCFAPVLSMDEALEHPHNVARGTFTTIDDIPQPSPAPRFSRTSPEIQRPPAHPGQHTDEVLADFGFAPDEVAKLRDAGAVA